MKTIIRKTPENGIDVQGVAGPMRAILSPSKEGEKYRGSIIRFYDLRYPHTEDGQSISNYYVSSLFEYHPTCGLDLCGYAPD